jgi:hypothetical protein
MNYFLNSTADYHRNELNSLGWELTVCNSLEPPDSPCRKALHKPLSFGRHLYHFLENVISMENIAAVVEIGGGMGYLMRDFLILNPKLRAKMIDISPYLLNRQKETLQSMKVDFELADILTVAHEKLSSFDLAILNENLGDMPTLVAVPEKNSFSDENELCHLRKLRHFCGTYGLPLEKDRFVNIGALEIIEKLCLAGIRYIYLSEHSCEAVVPRKMKSYLSFSSAGHPEKISLKGHQEFTIKFSYLQKIANMLHYTSKRGTLADFLSLQLNDKIKTALRLTTPLSDEQEIIRQFVYDLYKYEYLILIQGGVS